MRLTIDRKSYLLICRSDGLMDWYRIEIGLADGDGLTLDWRIGDGLTSDWIERRRSGLIGFALVQTRAVSLALELSIELWIGHM